jgi:D-3-phosphoglycerate dehydrogenase
MAVNTNGKRLREEEAESINEKTSYPKNKIKVLLLEGVSAKGIGILRDDGLNVEALKTALTEDELVERVKGVHILGIRSKTQVTQKVLEASNRLLAIACFCIGTDQVNLKFAQEKGIPVFNAPFANTRSVAELIIGNIVGLSRRIGDCTAAMHRGAWFKQAIGCFEIRGKTLGLVGYGHIASQVSVLAEAMGMNVIYYDVVPKLPMGNAVQINTFPEMLSKSDFVSLHVPKLQSTKDMMGAEEFAHMKKGSFFLNASRGNVVVIPALAEALKSGHLRGAYVDVFPVEPGKNGEGLFESELRGCPNVLMTPHVGGSTEEAQEKIGEEVAAALLKCLNEGSTYGAVNFPEVDMKVDSSVKTHRVLCIHKNQPGVMSAINNIFTEAKSNICQQFLNTKGAVGYVAIDLNVEASVEVKKKLSDLDSVLKVRVLY